MRFLNRRTNLRPLARDRARKKSLSQKPSNPTRLQVWKSWRTLKIHSWLCLLERSTWNVLTLTRKNTKW